LRQISFSPSIKIMFSFWLDSIFQLILHNLGVGGVVLDNCPTYFLSPYYYLIF
jgi:hypothetical protein